MTVPTEVVFRYLHLLMPWILLRSAVSLKGDTDIVGERLRWQAQGHSDFPRTPKLLAA